MKVAVVGAGAVGAHAGCALLRAAPDADHHRLRHLRMGCNVKLHVQDNELVEVTSPHDNPVTHGNLCIKGRFGFQHVQNRV